MKGIKHILAIPLQFYFMVIQFWPGPVGNKLRYWYWKGRLGSMGKSVIISEGVHIDSPENVFIGDRTWIDKNVILLAGAPNPEQRTTHFKANSSFGGKVGEIHIGSECHIAPFVLVSGLGGIEIGNRSGIASGSKLYSFSHHYRNLSDVNDNQVYSFSPMVDNTNQAMISGPIVLGEDCAIGVNCIVMPGVEIGSKTWIKAGSTVMKNIPKESISDGHEHKPKFNSNKTNS